MTDLHSKNKVDNLHEYIPELDMNEWFSGDEESKTKFAQKWDHAFRTSGFCTIINHGVPDHVMREMYSGAKEFFNLELSEKLKYKCDEFVGAGFHPSGEENFDAKDSESKKYDMNENYVFWSSPDNIDAFDTSKVYSPLNEKALKYWKSFRTLQKVLWDISDHTLGLEKGTFAHFHLDHGTPLNIFRLCDYFQVCPDQLSSENTKRIGGHTDFMIYTILKCDEVPGLEVAVGEVDFDKKNLSPTFDTWVKLNPRSNALIVNAGDMLRFWTNGRWKSSFHQVVMHPQRRISMVFFTGPGFSARTDARLPGFDSEVDKYKMNMTLREYFEYRKSMASNSY